MTADRTLIAAVLGDRPGFAAVAYGHGGHHTKDGKYEHTGWDEHQYSWPEQAEQLYADAEREAAAGSDVYWCPALRFNDKRRKGDALPPTWLWADLDGATANAELLDRIDPVRVASGGGPHRQHLYIPLSRPVDLGTHQALNQGLANAIAADAKWSDESLLRLPGTLNHKRDPAGLVEHLDGGPRVWDPDELGALLGVTATRTGQTASTTGPTGTVPVRTEAPPDPLPQTVRDALDNTDVADRSRAHHRVVGACVRADLTSGQTLAVLARYGPSRDKYGAQLAQEVARSWHKAIDEHARERLARSWENIVAGGGPTGPAPVTTGQTAVSTGPEPVKPQSAATLLPEEFWTARPSLTHVRQAAHARCVSGDAVLHAVLARVASFLPTGVKVDTSVGQPASLNTFTALIGAPGTGKTLAASTAAELLPVPMRLRDPGAYRDRAPLGSGEGLAELFMGEVEELDAKGKLAKRRGQVRHQVLVYCDEGEQLVKMMGERAGAIIGTTLRTAWVGGGLGQSNGTSATTRVVPAGSYALGLIVGFQPGATAGLLADAAGGTPQRFLFASAADPTIPDEAVPWPGDLQGIAPGAGLDAAGWGVAADGGQPVTVAPGIAAELRRRRLAAGRGEAVEGDPLDAHGDLHRAKLAALLALLDKREHIDEDDWSLAGIAWDTSRAVRSWLASLHTASVRREAQAREEAKVDTAVRSARATDAAREADADAQVVAAAESLAKWLHTHGPHGPNKTKRAQAYKRRGVFDEALVEAEARGWVTVADDGSLAPGASRPAP